MQGQKSTIDSVPENVDINLGSFPLTDSMTQQTYLSNRPNQEAVCSSSYATSTDASSSSHAVGDGGESFNAWNFASNQEGQPNFDGMKVEQGWSPSICTPTGAGPSSATRQLELQHSVLFPETAVSRNSDANLVRQNNPNAGPSISTFLTWESEDGNSTAVRSGNSAHSSGSSSHMDGRIAGSSSSMAAWGSSSCKRKALEGTSGQSNPSASSSSIPQAENFTWPNETPPAGNAPDPMNLSPPSSWNSPNVNFLEHLGPSTGLSMRESDFEPFPPVSITMGMGAAIGPRGFDSRGSSGPQQEPFTFNLASSPLSSLGHSRHSSGFSLSHRPGLSDLRSTRGALMNASASQTTQSNAIQEPQLPRNSLGIPWTGAQHSRSGSFTSSFLPGGSLDEVNSGSMSRYVSETPVVSSASETRNMVQDPPSWDLAAGLTSQSPSNVSSFRRVGQSSGSRSSLPPFVTPRPMSQEIRRVLELTPWGPELFDGQNTHLPGPSSSGPSSGPQGNGINSLGRRQHYHRPGFSVDRQGEELLAMSESPLRAFIGDIEGRNRVIAEIRQVLNAMRRGENLRAEDYMLFEPLMFQGLAEMHDRHRDMRLDVDNMSYEELLELEERIGDVSTGLKEETILKFLKQHKSQMPAGEKSLKDSEPCCICQEQYVDGDDIGELDCGHDFHVNCIKQWLTHKNLCPICKTTGLIT
ncbi:E3 ubiquitin-protein ligase MBR2 isoform X1 [Punica granatum]|uniref:RING-type E3 ubiquitin transferase n=2 Tax=Punica granatum TaxID=22663 RepID=A0A6P8CAE4_PUNGR|nr:E3 ubiquitin-protein ligase MBR2 isoform X1 [Punica granatum]XP_031380765.1 E3 ubiquitin-protein ligase MBR2 isoform X1 [Punica granatum]XP_031380767.1 E3 ubiquitin-protein ligase MBR2 isoform X1 [Punica granatum]